MVKGPLSIHLVYIKTTININYLYNDENRVLIVMQRDVSDVPISALSGLWDGEWRYD